MAEKEREIEKLQKSLTEEDIDFIKSHFSQKSIKFIEGMAVPWATYYTKEMKEKRKLSRLPPLEQPGDCLLSYKICQATGKVLINRDYGKRTIANKQVAKQNNPVLNTKQHDAASAETEEPTKKKRLTKSEQRAQLQSLRKELQKTVVQKALKPKERHAQLFAKVQRLTGIKPKGKNINYKVLMEQKKEEKKKAEEKKEHLKNIDMKEKIKKKRRVHRKRDPNDVAGWGSLGGRYRDGVMVVSSQMIESMKKK